MKTKSLCLSLLLFGFVTILQANNQPTKIKDVIVYLDGAQITRTTTIKLPLGTTTFTFSKLSPYIQESSIQVSGLSNSTILSINYGINYLSKQKQTEDIEMLKLKIESLKDAIQLQDDLISGYNEELSVIQSNRHLGNESEVVNLQKLKDFAKYYRTRLTEIRSLIYNSNKQINDYNKEISEINKQLVEYNVDEKVQTGEIKLKLNTSVSEALNLVIKYNVSNAGWFPMYDIKAEKINQPIQLVYKAHIFQNSGSDWENVRLTLSTSDPNTNNIKPNIETKFLNFVSNYTRQRATRSYNYKYNPLVKTVSGIVSSSSDGLPLPGVNIIESGTANGTQTDFDGRYSIRTNGGKDLAYSFIGMRSETLPIHSSIMNVVMDEDASALDEVVVSGYSTGTSSSIRYERKESLADVLAGSVSGVSITSSNGISGSSKQVLIRGISSLKKNGNPLYIVDGIPIKRNQFSQFDKDDIESISILKDVRATSIYGTRGVNGVIVIKTKNGKYTSTGNFIEQGITNVTFKIKKQHTIPSDGDVTVIQIESYSVPTEYVYFTAPVINENVFLTAKIGNWEQYNLLPAEANVYFEGSYSGKTNINPQATTDSLTISLGVDPNIVVKRTQLNDFKKNVFIGNNKIINKAYQIELKNNKITDIDIVLVDRIPISQNKAIKIDDVDSGTSQYDSKKGIMTWNIKLKVQKSQKFNFEYNVKYPKYKSINL